MKIDHTSGMNFYPDTFTNRMFILYLKKLTLHLRWPYISGPYKGDLMYNFLKYPSSFMYAEQRSVTGNDMASPFALVCVALSFLLCVLNCFPQCFILKTSPESMRSRKELGTVFVWGVSGEQFCINMLHSSNYWRITLHWAHIPPNNGIKMFIT